jgi:L-asparaginase
LKAIVADCVSSLTTYMPAAIQGLDMNLARKEYKVTVATALSGTGNGDSFLRMNACRTASAIARYGLSLGLKDGVEQITGREGELQKSAGDRWEKTGEGEGGIIGIECICFYNAEGEVIGCATDIVEDFNCGGMFRAIITNEGKAVVRVWRPGHHHDLLENYEGEGKEYDFRLRLSEKS